MVRLAAILSRPSSVLGPSDGSIFCVGTRRANRYGARMEIEFWYDFSSPWTYLASTQVERVVERAGGSLTWRPMLLGAVFKQVGTSDVPMMAMPEAKRNYYARELPLWAAHWEVPFKFTTHFPIRTVTALRLALQARDAVGPLSHALFRAAWVEDRSLNDEAVLRDVLEGQKLDADGLLAGTQLPEVKQQLVESTAEAVGHGVFGAPSFRILHPDGDVLLWGQDRFELITKVLGGWHPE